MQHKPPRSAKRTFPPHIHRRLTAVSATCRRISSTLAIVALVSLLVLWSILMAVSRDNEAHAQVSILTGSQQLSPNNRVLAQNPPVVILKRLSPNPIQVGQRLRIEVRISPPLPEGADRLIGGVQIFDPAENTGADLHAFAFHAGQTTVDAVSYLVPGPNDGYQVPRTIRVAVNPAFFPDYQVGSPASDTVRVIGVGDPLPPTPTAVPPPPPPPPLPTATFTPTNTPLPTATFTPTNTPRPTATFTPTNTPLPTATFTPTNTPLPTATFTPTNTPLPTATSRPTNTPLPTATSRPTNTPLPTATSRPTNTPLPTATSRPTNTPLPTATSRPTNTPRPTATFTFTPTPTYTATATPTVTPTTTSTPTNTVTVVATATFTPTNTPQPTATFTPTPTHTTTATPTATVTPTPTSTHTATVTPAPTVSPTPTKERKRNPQPRSALRTLRFLRRLLRQPPLSCLRLHWRQPRQLLRSRRLRQNRLSALFSGGIPRLPHLPRLPPRRPSRLPLRLRLSLRLHRLRQP